MEKKRFLYFLLAVIMVFGMLPTHSYAVDADEQERIPMDYVLVVDVSDTMDDAAPDQVCASACDLFMDLLPYRNVRVGVIAYGYNGSKKDLYPFSGEFNVTFEDEYVHLIADMEESSTAMSRTDIMEKLEKAYQQDGSRSTHGQALMAAVDMLNRANAQKGQASIILMTDGELATQDWLTTDNYKKTAVTEARENGWPIYTIELDFNGKHTDLGNVDPAVLDSSDYHGSSKYSRALTTEIAFDTGAKKYPLTEEGTIDESADPELGTWVISAKKSANDLINKIHLAFMQILKGKITPYESDHGDIIVDCPIPNLTCEYVLGVTAVGLESITVQQPGDASGVTYSVSNSDDPTRIIEKGNQHFTVRLFCPVPGDWKITAHCVEDVEATVYEDLTTDVEIALNGSSIYNGTSVELTAGEAAQLDKRGRIDFRAELSYHGDRMYLAPNDGDTKAFLETYLDNNGALTKLDVREMLISKGGFVLESLPLADLVGSDPDRMGSYAVRMRMENDRLPGGRVFSDTLRFRAEDLDALFHGDALPAVSAPVFSLCRIDLEGLLENPDGDELEFQLLCDDPNGPDFCFANGQRTITGNLDSLDICAGAYAGVHELVLRVVDFQTVHTYTLELTVTNEAPIPAGEKIELSLCYGELAAPLDSTLNFIGKIFPSVERWFRSKLTDDSVSDYLLTLDDPEGQALEYVVTNEGASVDGELICRTAETDSGLSVIPNKDGSTTLEVVIHDGTYVRDDSGTYVKAAFPRTLKVQVESVRNNLRDSLIMMMIMVAAFVLVLLVVRKIIKSNTMIRGDWTVEIRVGGDEPLSCYARGLQGGKKTTLPDIVRTAYNTLERSGSNNRKLTAEQKVLLDDAIDTWFKENGDGQYGAMKSLNVEKIRFTGVLTRKHAMKVKHIEKDLRCEVKVRGRSSVGKRTLTLNRGDSISFILTSGAQGNDTNCTITLRCKR